MALPSPPEERPAECVGEDYPGYAGLFLLMTVLSQSFLTLVRSHLVAFPFLSAGHNN